MTERVIVTVNEGKIKGVRAKSTYSGAEFYSFYGVPYAQPPISHLRFKDPVKVKPWKTAYDATKEKPGCVQYCLTDYEMMGNEDCLFNNIHTPKLPNKNDPLKPVIVNIHPGGFMFGTPNSDRYGSPSFIMHHDIVYVVIGFRLHIFGFMNLGIKDCSGNQALKDIIMSLQWIKDNISSFGGDPENITLLGSSSGSSSVNFLMVSPAAKGLFHKAILMGVYAFHPIALFRDTNEQYVKDIALSLGYEGNPDEKKELLSFMKKQDPLALIIAQRSCIKNFYKDLVSMYPVGVFSPTMDHGPIFPESPRKLIKSMARIPIITGFCDKESVMAFARGDIIKNTEANFKTAIRQNPWGWGHNLTDNDIQLISKEMESFYTNGEPIERAPVPVKVQILNDATLSDLYDVFVNVIAEDLPSSVFIYKFHFEGEIITMKTALTFTLDEHLDGTYHGCDYSYWNAFNEPHDKPTRKMVETMTKLFTTFAKTGNPNFENFEVTWKPTTPDKPCYLRIDKTSTLVDGIVNSDGLEFWHRIKQKFRKD